jgi:hypothetical protein
LVEDKEEEEEREEEEEGEEADRNDVIFFRDLLHRKYVQHAQGQVTKLFT